MGAIALDTLALALGAGMLAAVNPCGFALLPVYLSMFVLDEQPTPVVAIGRALRATAAMTAGFATVFAIFGLAIAPVAGSVQRYLPGFTVVLGVLIVAAGLWMLAGRRFPGLRVGRLGGRPGGRPVTTSVTSMAGFGASYAIASLGCTIAPFLAVVVTAFRAGSTTEGIALFLAYAAGMGLVVGTAAVAVALANTGLVSRLRRAGAVLPRAAGALLVVAGGYVAWYGVWELRVLEGGAGRDPVVDAAGNLQQWLATTAREIGGGGFLIALLALVAVGLAWRARARWQSDHAPPVTPTTESRTEETHP